MIGVLLAASACSTARGPVTVPTNSATGAVDELPQLVGVITTEGLVCSDHELDTEGGGDVTEIELCGCGRPDGLGPLVPGQPDPRLPLERNGLGAQPDPGPRGPGGPHASDSRMSAAITGSKKHSVFPEPVPVVTTTSFSFTTDSSNTSR